MKKKLCQICNVWLDKTEFGSDKSRKKDGLSLKCKLCDKIRNKNYCDRNRDKINLRVRNYDRLQRFLRESDIEGWIKRI